MRMYRWFLSEIMMFYFALHTIPSLSFPRLFYIAECIHS